MADAAMRYKRVWYSYLQQSIINVFLCFLTVPVVSALLRHELSTNQSAPAKATMTVVQCSVHHFCIAVHLEHMCPPHCNLFCCFFLLFSAKLITP